MDKFDYFKTISRIPRETFYEKEISDYIVGIAKNNNYEYFRDENNNVIIYKKGSKGREDEESIILQAHMDMVAEKDKISEHNFRKDPIEVIVENNWVKANGTTLGADDGFGVSYMLDILTNNTYSHPPLELVFTASEEYGMQGIIKFKNWDKLKSKRMIGLDFDDENSTCISCVSGSTGNIEIPHNINTKYNKTLEIEIDGLLGGHSGVDIVKERGNSIKIISEILYYLCKKFDIGLAYIYGGEKNNSIPRYSKVKVGFNDSEKEILFLLNQLIKEYEYQYKDSDKNLKINYKVIDQNINTASNKESRELLSILFLFPSGVIHKSIRFENLPMISNNLGKIRTENKKISIEFNARSFQNYLMEKLKEKIFLISKNYKISYTNEYPGWTTKENSKLRELYCKIYEKDTGKKLKLLPSGGGMEIAVFNSNLKDLDIITMGPDIIDFHSPSEKMNLHSYNRVFDRLIRMLEII